MPLHAQSQAVHRFCQTLVQDATVVPKILITSDDLAAAQQILTAGFPPDSITVVTPDSAHHAQYFELGLNPQIKDLRLWTPPPDQWDGIWAPQVFSESTTTQRILLTLFRCLKPQGHLWAQWEGPHWTETTAHPLLRQSGFDVILEARLSNPAVQQGALCRRV